MPQKLLINSRGRTITVPLDKVPEKLAQGFIHAPDDALLGQYYPLHDQANELEPYVVGEKETPEITTEPEINLGTYKEKDYPNREAMAEQIQTDAVKAVKKEPHKQKMFKRKKTSKKA